MQKVNIYVGSAALLLSSEKRSNQFLIGRKTEGSDYELDIGLDFIPTTEVCDYKQSQEFWYQSTNNFQELLNQLKSKAAPYFKPLQQLKNYQFCYVITAPGGLFSNVVTGLVLDFLAWNNINFRMIVLDPGYKLLQAKRHILIQHIHQNFPSIVYSSVSFSEEEINFYGKRTLHETYNELTDRMIKYINNATF